MFHISATAGAQTRPRMDSTTENLELARPALASGEACPTCGALVAPDQRYCVDCGERQGAPRFTLPVTATKVTTTTTPRRRPSAGASTTFVLGVATLLVAMAVGVLIGRSGARGTPQAAAPVRVVTVGGTGTAAVSATATPAATATSGKGGKKKPAKPAATPAGPKIVRIVKTPPPTVQVGQKGSGPGYKNGRFTGDFFGP
jgi:uncharacterized OB-fold protein